LISADGINGSGDIVGWVLDGVGQHGQCPVKIEILRAV
jgi:hypothetical protein